MAKRLLEFMDERVVPKSNPRSIGHALTGPMKGAYWRYRVGDYRIICEIQDDVLCVLVIEIGHRKEVYR
jgi:mRNA interferase RelE/StbE